MGRPAARIPPESVAAIIVNAKLAAQQTVKALSHSSAKVFVIHNDLTPQPGEIGNERQKIGNWIGTATTDTAGQLHLDGGRQWL